MNGVVFWVSVAHYPSFVDAPSFGTHGKSEVWTLEQGRPASERRLGGLGNEDTED
jgi:hypothetical protein